MDFNKTLRRLTLLMAAIVFFAGARAQAGPVRTWKIAVLAPKHFVGARQVHKHVLPWVRISSGGLLKWRVYWGGLAGKEKDFLFPFLKVFGSFLRGSCLDNIIGNLKGVS